MESTVRTVGVVKLYHLRAGTAGEQNDLRPQRPEIYASLKQELIDYFDNIKFAAFPFAGPTIVGGSDKLFNDNFPEAGDLDFADLSNNYVRIDMARSYPDGAPGDSIVVTVEAVRAGSVLDDMPKLYVKMKANPLFDDVRVLPPNFIQTGDIINGWVYGDSTYTANGDLVPDRYNFDLPDDEFFFPGDVFNYYIEARDNLAGDIGTTLMPGDKRRAITASK